MSRGLGRLQRFIKEQIYQRQREYKREAVILNARHKLDPNFDPVDEGVKRIFTLWWDVRRWVEEKPEFNLGPYRLSEALERSTKRALHTLVKRGEIVVWREHGYLNRYMTKEADQFFRETGKAVMEGFARMAEAEKLGQSTSEEGSGPLEG